MSHTYLYCIGSSELASDWGSNGIGGGRVYAVRAGSLAALVSAVPPEIGVPRLVREHLLAHEFVVWAASRETAVLPVAFGTVFRGDGDAAAALAAIRDEVQAALDAVGDRVELGVRAVWCGDGARPSAAGLLRDVRAAVGEAVGAVAALEPVGERTLLAAALLVARRDARDVADRLHAVGHALEGSVRIVVTGAWAPYHFARLRLRVDPARRDARADARDA